MYNFWSISLQIVFGNVSKKKIPDNNALTAEAPSGRNGVCLDNTTLLAGNPAKTMVQLYDVNAVKTRPGLLSDMIFNYVGLYYSYSTYSPICEKIYFYSPM